MTPPKTPKPATKQPAAKKSTAKASSNTDAAAPNPALSEVRARIDSIDTQIQSLIAERAQFALQVGKAKGPLKAAIDYYRPEREAQVRGTDEPPV